MPTTDQEEPVRSSLSTQAARNLATTTKTVPQMQGISSRWLLRKLPWVNVSSGTYRVNRRLSLAVGRGRVGFEVNGADDVRIIPDTLRELPILRGFPDDALLAELAGGFRPREFRAGDVLAAQGEPISEVFIIAHGRIELIGNLRYGASGVVRVVADGHALGDEIHDQEGEPVWGHTLKASTSGTVMVLPRASFQRLYDGSEALRRQIADFQARARRPADGKGQASIDLSAGHAGEPVLPGTFVDYELAPREYELSLTQTVLRVHTRVADLFNNPMNQTEEQLRLTVEAIREREEWELLNNRDFGLLHNADYEQRINTKSGPPTPDDLDNLLSMRRSTKLFLAHPKTIAAFFRECNSRGLYVDAVNIDDHRIPAWRGVPIYPCGKIPISDTFTSSILALRTGEDNQGVVGLHQTGIPDEYSPGLNVRFMGIDEKAILSYLVTAYYSTAILVPDAIGVLENVDIAS
ncbi:cyclic nucleotide-binding domain-containing protein [Actinospica sp. MGRD01-02]|uniref:Cyclic nucleotide-binding domain-containing protein n=1 Tax=Actinospica acidithermotolerans TaxID=2828514 RepID=A0A941IJZ9_9ACTN|nr:family 2B encapsulin nanocompartment shell protein [Actinospica acidithermotolerans]MBR7826226.1 cyclic nucleotide-binding domain-containing protein [Actinospica acidithermotolerans]